MTLDWQADAAIATMISSVAIVAGAIFVVIQLRQAARDRYYTITANLFELWQSSEFQDDQLFLLCRRNQIRRARSHGGDGCCRLLHWRQA
jgi:hypothetical protein